MADPRWANKSDTDSPELDSVSFSALSWYWVTKENSPPPHFCGLRRFRRLLHVRYILILSLIATLQSGKVRII